MSNIDTRQQLEIFLGLNSRGLSRGICDFHVWVLFFSENFLSSVVVLRELGRIAFNKGRYEESLQLLGRAHDILMTTSPKSEDLATGRQ